MRSTILVVDDEPNVLEGLSLHLLRKYNVVTATSGPEALAALSEEPRISVIVSDLRMPEMDGAQFLGRAREVVPDSVRILLTGHADVDGAMRAINEGGVFKVLTKPCPPGQLLNTIAAAEHHYQVVEADRIMLEQTMAGAIRALTDVLGHTNPASYRRAALIKRTASDIAAALDINPRWPVEVAAALSQLGFLTVPGETVERLFAGGELSEAERSKIGRVPAINEQLLARIPRLEPVRALLNSLSRPYRKPQSETPGGSRDPIDRASQVVRVAVDFEALMGAGDHAALAVDTMRSRDCYDPAVLDALESVRGRGHGFEIRMLRVGALKPGMIFADDVKLSNGALLVTRGFEITPSFLDRAQHMRDGAVREPIRVIVRRQQREVA